MQRLRRMRRNYQKFFKMKIQQQRRQLRSKITVSSVSHRLPVGGESLPITSSVPELTITDFLFSPDSVSKSRNRLHLSTVTFKSASLHLLSTVISQSVNPVLRLTLSEIVAAAILQQPLLLFVSVPVTSHVSVHSNLDTSNTLPNHRHLSLLEEQASARIRILIVEISVEVEQSNSGRTAITIYDFEETERSISIPTLR